MIIKTDRLTDLAIKRLKGLGVHAIFMIRYPWTKLIALFLVGMIMPISNGAANELTGAGAGAAAGKGLFIRCVACHAVRADAGPKMGPHLEGIVGRQVASVSGYNYTEALRGQTFIWTEAQLDEWLKNPQSIHPGVCMPFMGLAKPSDRQALIAYLKNPLP